MVNRRLFIAGLLSSAPLLGGWKHGTPHEFILNVKDFGAVGNGIADDGPAIQKTINASYSSTNRQSSQYWVNKGIYIPAGTYLIGQQLFYYPSGFNSSAGGWLFGDGQRNTRLVYAGADTGLGGVTSLLTTQFLNQSHVQGITFDVTGSNAKCCVHNSDISPGTNGGSAVSWVDVGFIGATSFGFLFDMGSEGSEQFFLNPTFDGCTGATSNLHDRLGNPIGGGLILTSPNALDHTVIGGRFTNNGAGILAVQGGVNLIQGVQFSNNSDIDIWVKQQNAPLITGCYSDSTTFCCAGPVKIVGCQHVTSGVGVFYQGSGVKYDQDLPLVVIDGCIAPNSKLVSNNGAGVTVYLRGNTFGRGDYLTDWLGIVGENI